MICPSCNSQNALKVIAAAMPIKYCEDCGAFWGEPFASLYFFIVMPIEDYFSDADGFYLMSYEGPYLLALWHWLFYL